MKFVDIRLTLSDDSTGPLLTDTKVLDTNVSQEDRDLLVSNWDELETDAIHDALLDVEAGKGMDELFTHQR